MITLVRPAIEYKDSFINAVYEYQSEGRYTELSVENLEQDFDGYVQSLLNREKGIGLPEGYVPETVFWAVLDKDFVGRISVRHHLTKHLTNFGGHIGYDVRPSARQKGFGKQMLRLVLPYAKKLGLQRALITCDEDNVGSRKIIEANGGVYEDKRYDEEVHRFTLRFWIPL